MTKFTIYCTCTGKTLVRQWAARALPCGCNDHRRQSCTRACRTATSTATKCYCDCYGENHGADVSEAVLIGLAQ